MFRSIRWALQLWHAGLLAVVLIGFGTVTYFGLSRMRYHELDAELQRSLLTLMGGFRPPGRPSPGDAPAGGPPWESRRARREERSERPPQPPDREGPTFPNDAPAEAEDWLREGRDARQPDFEVPSALADRFASGEAYYVIWDSTGRVLWTSDTTLEVPTPDLAVHGPHNIEPPRVRQRGDRREACLSGPFGMRILVGRSTQPDQAQLRRLAFLLAATGAGVLIVGLAGGWILSLRVVRPIETITAVAQEISATNLSRRIDVTGTKSELGTLAIVLNNAFARLETAFQQQVRFTADASHELRTPLSVVHTHAQLALARPRSAEEYRKMFETCLQASDHMKGLIESLLLLARADAGRLPLDLSVVDLSTIVEDSIKLITPLAAGKNVSIETDLPTVKLTADASMLTQVVTNLLTNAIRYNREGGHVRAAVESSGGDALLIVADTGVGISPEHQPHVFERFYRADVARSREEGGSGLGLAICRSMVEAHGGIITLHSEEGRGTTFTVRVPKSPPVGIVPPAARPPQRPSPSQ